MKTESPGKFIDDDLIWTIARGKALPCGQVLWFRISPIPPWPRL
jgi:hypothetical protein